MLDHVSNLALHRDGEQDDEVEQQDRPEHGDVEDVETLHEQSGSSGARAGIPEFKLWDASSKRSTEHIQHNN